MFAEPHYFDGIISDRPLTHDLFGKVSRKWPVIYADPCWEFSNRSEKGEDRNANQHYPTMSIDELMAMPVADIAAEDSTLLLWVTDPTLHHAMRLLQAWGFEYKTVLAYWAKTWDHCDPEAMHYKKSFPMANGYTTRANPEQLWMATRGEPTRRVHNIDGVLKPDMSIRRLQFAPRRQHSEKPDQFYEIIERLFDGPYLELFSRRSRPGWSRWGNQTELLDNGSVDTRARKPKFIAPVPLLEGIAA